MTSEEKRKKYLSILEFESKLNQLKEDDEILEFLGFGGGFEKVQPGRAKVMEYVKSARAKCQNSKDTNKCYLAVAIKANNMCKSALTNCKNSSNPEKCMKLWRGDIIANERYISSLR